MNVQSIDNINLYWKQIFHALKRASRPILENLGLTKVDANILLALSRQTESSKAELAEKLSFEANSLTRSLDRLVEIGAIHRTTAKEDKRFIKLSLTVKGKSITRNYITSLRNIWIQLLGTLSETEIKELENILSKILHHIEDKTLK